MRKVLFLVVLSLNPRVALAAVAGSTNVASCHAGAYRNAAGDLLTLVPDTEEPGSLRFYLVSGETGLLRPDAAGHYVAGPGWSERQPIVARAQLGSCGGGKVGFELKDGPSGQWNKVPLSSTKIRFRNAGAELSGELIAPSTQQRWPVVILVHGSEQTAWVEHNPWQWLLPAQGVAFFIYDKRGTGESSGTFSMNFSILASDVVAAVHRVRQMVGPGHRVGLFGGSQGGWVAPLAATRTSIDFLEIGFALTGSPCDQDMQVVEYELTQRGYGPEILEKAHELTTITAFIAASNFTSGYEQLETLKRRFLGETWLHQVEGEYTGALLRGESAEKLRQENPGLDWHYDSLSVLRTLKVPQLWMLGTEDDTAPSGPTIAQLKLLQTQGMPIDIAVFPHADHGIVNFEVQPDGTRRRTRRANGFFKLQADWAQAISSAHYGDAILLLHHPATEPHSRN
jgi:pimeloyl-ACP methyl ester carboxylesterase